MTSAVGLNTALLLAPIASSTASLLFAWDQHLFLSIFTRQPIAASHGETILPAYWRALLPWGLTEVLGLLATTAATSGAALWKYSDFLRQKESFNWYAAAGVLALGHLAYAPAVSWRIDAMSRGDEAGTREAVGSEKATSNVELQKGWLRYNMMRMLTTDLGAWVCVCVAAVRTFS